MFSHRESGFEYSVINRLNHGLRNHQTSASLRKAVGLSMTIADQKPPSGKNKVRLTLDRTPMRNVAEGQMCEGANAVLPSEDARGALDKGVG